MQTIAIFHLVGKTRELPMELTFGGDVALTEQAWKGQLEGASYKKVASFEIPDHVDAENFLDTAFEVTNTIDGPWYEHPQLNVEAPYKFRSTSVGDVIEAGGKKYLVAGCGFEKLGV